MRVVCQSLSFSDSVGGLGGSVRGLWPTYLHIRGSILFASTGRWLLLFFSCEKSTYLNSGLPIGCFLVESSSLPLRFCGLEVGHAGIRTSIRRRGLPCRPGKAMETGPAMRVLWGAPHPQQIGLTTTPNSWMLYLLKNNACS